MTGLREAHAHIAAHGREMSQLNLADCVSHRECLERLRAEVSRLDALGEPGWVVANGVRVEGWVEDRGSAAWPTLTELDLISPRRPCMVQSFDHHACAVNHAAFLAAGFTRSSPDPKGGRIVRGADGEPTGVLLESAYGAARKAVPEPTPDQWRRFVKTGLNDLSSHGFTEVHDLLSPPWLGPVLAEMDQAGELPVSVWLYPILEEAEGVAAGRRGWQRDRVKLAGAKMFADGTLNSRTAWMLHPYADALPGMACGQAMVTPAQLDGALAATARLGVGLAVHAIGDGAVRAVLDAFERAEGLRGDRRRDAWGVREIPVQPGDGGVPVLRIEHAELIDEVDVPRFARLGVVCSVQPCHLLYDIEALMRGQPARLDRVLPLRELIDSGCRTGGMLWFGSDVPIVRPNPVDSITAAVHRAREDSAAISLPQAISEDEAWASFRRA